MVAVVLFIVIPVIFFLGFLGLYVFLLRRRRSAEQRHRDLESQSYLEGDLLEYSPRASFTITEGGTSLWGSLADSRSARVTPENGELRIGLPALPGISLPHSQHHVPRRRARNSRSSLSDAASTSNRSHVNPSEAPSIRPEWSSARADPICIPDAMQTALGGCVLAAEADTEEESEASPHPVAIPVFTTPEQVDAYKNEQRAYRRDLRAAARRARREEEHRQRKQQLGAAGTSRREVSMVSDSFASDTFLVGSSKSVTSEKEVPYPHASYYKRPSESVSLPEPPSPFGPASSSSSSSFQANSRANSTVDAWNVLLQPGEGNIQWLIDPTVHHILPSEASNAEASYSSHGILMPADGIMDDSLKDSMYSETEVEMIRTNDAPLVTTVGSSTGTKNKSDHGAVGIETLKEDSSYDDPSMLHFTSSSDPSHAGKKDILLSTEPEQFQASHGFSPRKHSSQMGAGGLTTEVSSSYFPPSVSQGGISSALFAFSQSTQDDINGISRLSLSKQSRLSASRRPPVVVEE